jgi:hypothetical protein
MSEKKIPSSRQTLIKRLIYPLVILMGAIVVCPLALIGMFLFILYASETGEIRADMPSSIVPTAEYLSRYPVLRPDYILADPMVWEDSIDKVTRICILANLKGFPNVPDSALFIINGARISDDFTSGSSGAELDRSPLFDTRDPKYKDATLSCAKPPLNKGLHLIEFQPSPFMIDTAGNYKWVIEVK